MLSLSPSSDRPSISHCLPGERAKPTPTLFRSVCDKCFLTGNSQEFAVGPRQDVLSMALEPILVALGPFELYPDLLDSHRVGHFLDDKLRLGGSADLHIHRCVFLR